MTVTKARLILGLVERMASLDRWMDRSLARLCNVGVFIARAAIERCGYFTDNIGSTDEV